MSTILFHPHKIFIIDGKVNDKLRSILNGICKEATMQTMSYPFCEKSKNEVIKHLDDNGFKYTTRG